MTVLVCLLACLAVASAQNNAIFVRVLNRLTLPATTTNVQGTTPAVQYTTTAVQPRMVLAPNGLVTTATTVSLNTVSSNTLSQYELFDTKSRSASFSLFSNQAGLVPANQLCTVSLQPGYNTITVTQNVQIIADGVATCPALNGQCTTAGVVNPDLVSFQCNAVLDTLPATRKCFESEVFFSRFDTETCPLQLKLNKLATVFPTLPAATLANLDIFRSDILLTTTQAPGTGSLSTTGISLLEARDYDLKSSVGTSVASLVDTRFGRKFEVITGITGAGLTNNVASTSTAFVAIVNGAYRTTPLPVGVNQVVQMSNNFPYAIFTNGALITSGTVQAGTATPYMEFREGSYTVNIYDPAVTPLVLVQVATTPTATPAISTATFTVTANTRDTYLAVVLTGPAGSNNAQAQTGAPTATVRTISDFKFVDVGDTQYTVYNDIASGPALSLFDSNTAICKDIKNTLANKVATGNSVSFVNNDDTVSGTVLLQAGAVDNRNIGTQVASLTSTGGAGSRLNSGCGKKVHFVFGRSISYQVAAPNPGCSSSLGGVITCGTSTVNVITSIKTTSAAPTAGVDIVTLEVDSCFCKTTAVCPVRTATCDEQFLTGLLSNDLNAAAASVAASANAVRNSGAAFASSAATQTVRALLPAINGVADDVEDLLDDGIEDLEDVIDDGIDDQQKDLKKIQSAADGAEKVSEKNKDLIKFLRSQNNDILAAVLPQPPIVP